MLGLTWWVFCYKAIYWENLLSCLANIIWGPIKTCDWLRPVEIKLWEKWENLNMIHKDFLIHRNDFFVVRSPFQRRSDRQNHPNTHSTCDSKKSYDVSSIIWTLRTQKAPCSAISWITICTKNTLITGYTVSNGIVIWRLNAPKVKL